MGLRLLPVCCFIAALFVLAAVQALSAQDALPQQTYANRKVTLQTLRNRAVRLTGGALLALTDPDKPIENATIEIASEDAWVFLPKVRPSAVASQYLKLVSVSDEPAEPGVNCRVAAYLRGSIVIPHSPGYPALQAYTRSNFHGDRMDFPIHTYHRAAELGDHNDAIHSIVLKRGYMATLAANEDGSGASRVFIARVADLRLRALPRNLAGRVSFVRVFPWRWTGKKGYGGSTDQSEQLACDWHYDWTASRRSTLDLEYVPMCHNDRRPDWEKINALRDVTHALGFNEPMQASQANMSIERCLELWPRLQESGLRLGSPSPTDGSVDWLYRFIDEADRRGLRVDFVAVHYYKPDWTPDRLINWLQKIHARTRRPLWVTEFNNGAPWCKGHHPRPEENAQRIDQFIHAMDACPFVERYAVFNCGPDSGNRRVILDDELTPAGKRYRHHTAPEAFLGD
jgi:hypothetical protein